MKNLAGGVPNKRVHVTIAVHVDERRCGSSSDVDIERIVRSRVLDKGGIRDAAGVFEMKNLAVVVPNKRVHVTVAVHVDERRCGVISDVDTVERIVLCILAARSIVAAILVALSVSHLARV